MSSSQAPTASPEVLEASLRVAHRRLEALQQANQEHALAHAYLQSQLRHTQEHVTALEARLVALEANHAIM
jgi:hypothetical protein